MGSVKNLPIANAQVSFFGNTRRQGTDSVLSGGSLRIRANSSTDTLGDGNRQQDGEGAVNQPLPHEIALSSDYTCLAGGVTKAALSWGCARCMELQRSNRIPESGG